MSLAFLGTICLALASTPAHGSSAGSVELYKGDDELVFDCNVDLREPFSCYCLQPGLWRVYSSCSDYKTLGVETKTCFIPNEQTKKLERVGRIGSGLSVVGPGGESREFRWEAIQVVKGDNLLVQHPTTVSDGRTSLCLSNVQRRDYCLYEPPSDLLSVVSVEEGCRPNITHVPPSECYPITTGLRSCSDSEGLGPELKRPKRMFLPWAVNVTPVADNSSIAEEDEDYYLDPLTNKSSLAILTEIWNYFDRQTDILLGLREAEHDYVYVTPIFQVLQLSLNVMKKTCPPHYVPPGFLDMAVNSFIQLLRKRKFFTEFGNDYEGIERIKVALMKCEANQTFFPFRMFQNDTCNNTVTPVGGFSLYGYLSEIEITQNSTSWAHEPIIDTAWKVFYNAHQFCFEHFDPVFNDHHRYGSLIESLFQNSVYNIWVTGETRFDMFGGFFGNMIDLTNKVAYCAMTSSLETGYPWDIPRPDADDISTRLKRSLPSDHSESQPATCLSNLKCTEIDGSLG